MSSGMTSARAVSTVELPAEVTSAEPQAARERASQTRDAERVHTLLPLRDAAIATAGLVVAVAAGSRGFRDLDPALLGYLGATVVATAATAWRVSAFWRRPASVFYARALLRSLATPRRLRRSLATASDTLVAQSFIRRRSRLRWAAHVLLSLGTLASFAIVLPLVFGWLQFRAEGASDYRIALFGLPTLRFATGGVFAWLVFHALSLAGVAVLLGAAIFLALRVRTRHLVGATESFAVAPLVLLLVVAATGLALPASRGWPALFPIAAWLHEVSVIVLLVAIPFSKLGHVLVRPLQLGARAVRSPDEPWLSCTGCGAALAPVAQRRAVDELLARRGLLSVEQRSSCPACRRKALAAAQAALVGAQFQPRIVGAAPRTRAPAEQQEI